MCLQETKFKETTLVLVRSVSGGRFVDLIVVDAVGTSGGILILWDSRVTQIMGKEEG